MRSRILVALGLSTLYAATCHAQESDPRSRRLFAAGRARYEQGEYQQAEVFLRGALTFDRGNGEIRVWLGRTYLRQGLPREALDQFEQAGPRGALAFADLELEKAGCAVALERWEEAVSMAGRFEAASPGRWETAEILGLSHFALGRWAVAGRWFDEAAKRGDPHEAVLAYHRGRIAEELGQPELATQNFEEARRKDPDSVFGRDAADRLFAREPEPGQPAEEERRKDLTVRLTLAGGWNDNVILRGEDVPLAGEITREEAAVFNEQLLISYAIRPFEAASIVLSNTTFGIQYVDLHEFNTTGVNPQISFNYAFSDEWRAQVGSGFSEFWVDSDHFQYQFDEVAKVVWRPEFAPWTESVLAYTHSRFEFFGGSGIHAFDRDGFSNTIRFTERASIPGTDLSVSAGYSHAWVHTEGTQFDRLEHVISTEVGHPIPVVDVDFGVSFSYAFDHYRRTQIGVGHEMQRRDRTLTLGVGLSKDITDSLRVFATYEFLDRNSNSDLFQFERNQYLLGIEFEF